MEKAKDLPDQWNRHLQGWARGRYPLLPRLVEDLWPQSELGAWHHFIRNQGATFTDSCMLTALLLYVAPRMWGARHTYLAEEKFLLRLSPAKRKKP